VPNRESSPEAQRLGSRIRESRQAEGLSQPELAKRARLSVSTIRKLEQGAAREPSFHAVARIADVLKLDLNRVGRPARGRLKRASLPARRLPGEAPRLVYIQLPMSHKSSRPKWLSLQGRVRHQSGGHIAVEPDRFDLRGD
jgi:transcriptional regulator with XRE-family HTH domain